jgi:hypothetical protein
VPIVYVFYCVVAMVALLFIRETRDLSLEELDHQEDARAAEKAKA